jgi:4-methoxybenzoate monooxygenase (O-demethylating)
VAAVAESTAVLDPPAFEWDPWTIENLVDPYPMNHALRETAPVVWLPKYNMYAVGRHEECKVVLSDYSRFMTSAGITMYDIRKAGLYRIPSRLLEVDPPLHTNIRSVVTRVMSPLIIRRMRDVFDTQAQQIAKEVLAKGDFEAVNEVTEPYVISAFPAAVGVKLERKAALAIAEMRFNQSGPHNEIYRKAMEEAEPFLEWYEEACQRSNVVPGSIADLLFEAEEAGELDEGVASNIVRTFVGGGVDSTISAIGHTLCNLARNPDQFALVKADLKKIRPAFEEAIRMDTPFQYSWRTTTRDTHLGDYRLASDTKVTVFFGSANRDPRRWDNPDRYDISRDTAGGYLGFGVADHNCIGQMIARFEADAILTAIVRGAKTIEFTSEPTYRPVNQMRMPGRVPLRVTRDEAA